MELLLFLGFSFLMFSASKNFGIDSGSSNLLHYFFIKSSGTRSPWDSWPLSNGVAAVAGDALARK
jgi:hypothetical protein